MASYSSHLTPHISHLTPHSLLLTPYSLLLTPHLLIFAHVSLSETVLLNTSFEGVES